MSLCPQLSGDFAPLFHLLDDYDVHRSRRTKHKVTSIQSFTPRFDVYQFNDGYCLNGELPGVDQNNVEIEFTDPQTLVIKGRVERDYSHGTLDDKAQCDSTGKGTSSIKSRQPTVEDEDDDSDRASTCSSDNTTNQAVYPKQTEPSYKFWASERSVGEFHRTFTFPTRVDQNKVKASLRDGILSVIVPREAAPKLKKIRVE
ncbi:hypothetical protein FE257_011916 [Aspergillus nanangensis]|uniref:SHSP domain-containing protein n=1 Tax=Aspergillus nanangensis TaxID=2582783 RepID=A0AAD4CH70_ASPNN|nr:hypothetical protein FE257_011916 [Aspergillus nanangensis]